MTYDRRARLKFYHASPRRFRNGDILVGGQPGGFGYAGHMVSLTTEPYPHITIKSNAVSEDWFVYEVEPNDKIQFLRTDYGMGEYRTRSATVIRNLGKARAFVQHDPEYLSFSLPEKNERDRQYKKRQGLRVVARYHQAQGSQHPQLYRGVSPSVKYTGYNWHANVYLTDDLESAAIYGRFGETYRAQVPDLIVVKADDDRVRDIEGSAHPEKRAMELGIQAVWNDSSFKVGKVFPHEFIVFDPHTQTSFSALTKPEQIKANRIKEIFKENPR